MKEQIKKRIEELKKLQVQTQANLNAIAGALGELNALLTADQPTIEAV
jgi:prefoldin subunit 5